MKELISVIIFIICVSSFSQSKLDNDLPYYEMQEYSEKFTAGTVAARMVDALGFRFYWASKDLTKKDLSFRATDNGRTSEETINHIYNLSKVILNSTLKKQNTSTKEELSYNELRAKTLVNLKTSADILRTSDDISQFKIILGEQEIPFWNQINGPISDAIWHCGQLVIYRRSTGNPINPKVNHFLGKISE